MVHPPMKKPVKNRTKKPLAKPLRRKGHAIRSVGFVIKHKVELAAKLAAELGTELIDEGYEVLGCVDSRQALGEFMPRPGAAKKWKFVTTANLAEKADLVVVLGGDGTFLGVARYMIKRSVPLIGVNMGTLGFLTEIRLSELRPILAAALAGKYQVSNRTLLQSWIERGGKKILETMVVNDVVISKSSIARIIELDLRINQNNVVSMRADGLIIGTPTGSTAYALAAGGPIIEPSVPALVIAPICPHVLTLRPLIVSDESHLEVIATHTDDAIVTFDGQASLKLQMGDQVHIRRFTAHPLQIVQSPSRNYFGILREKLKYGFRK